MSSFVPESNSEGFLDKGQHTLVNGLLQETYHGPIRVWMACYVSRAKESPTSSKGMFISIV